MLLCTGGAAKLSGYGWLLATFAGTICLSPFSVHDGVGVLIGFAVKAPIGPRLDLDGGCPLRELEGICKKLCFYMDHPPTPNEKSFAQLFQKRPPPRPQART